MDQYSGVANQYIGGTALGAMQAQAQAQAQAQIPREGELEGLIARVLRMTQDVEETAARLRRHADVVFGERPENSAGANAPTPVRTGLVGQLQDALDCLERANARTGVEAARNCALA